MGESRGCPLCGDELVAGGEGPAPWRCVGCAAEWVDLPPEAGGGGLVQSAGRYLLYGLTLPERTLRSSIGLAAGMVKETAQFLVPRAFQDSKTYGVVVRNSLTFLTRNIGGVVPADDDETPDIESFLARKTVGNFVEAVGIATLHLSPLWLLAIVSDIAYGTRTYVKELAVELKRKGLVAEDSTIGNVDELLAAVQDAAGEAAGLFDTPPLSVKQLKDTLESTRASLATADLTRIVPEGELTRYWGEMKEIAQQEDVSLLEISGAVTMHSLQRISTVSYGALTSLQVVGGLFSRHVIGHYIASLAALKERGFYTVVRETSEPYVEAVWNNFAIDRETWTEDVLSGRALGRGLSAIAGLFRSDDDDDTDAKDGDETANE